MADYVLKKDAIDWQFEAWQKIVSFEHPNIMDASDYARAAYRAGYLAMKDIAESNSCPAKTPTVREALTTNQRDALVAANALLSVMQDDRPELFNRIQSIVDEISDMLYEE